MKLHSPLVLPCGLFLWHFRYNYPGVLTLQIPQGIANFGVDRTKLEYAFTIGD
jgi:hypothetical protein